MKIAMFSNTYLPHVGGVARSVNTYEEELRGRGNRVNIIAPQFEGAAQSTEHVFRVSAIQNFNGSDFSLRIPQPWLLSKHFDEIEPQLIHSHHPFLLGDAALRTAYERHLPLLFTHHTMCEQYTHYVSMDSDAMKRFAIQMATEYCNLCHHVIAPSESIENLLKKRGVTVPITTIPTGIDLEFFGSGNGQRFRKRFDIPQNALVLGHVGRLAKEKNLDFLEEAVGSYLQKHTEAMFVIVGDGSYREEMENTFASSTADSQVFFTGCQTGQDLVDAYAAFDLFVFASQSETQGMVIAEAMTAENPVVALDGPGIREVVNDGNGRLLKENATPLGFVRAIKHLASDRDWLKKLGEEARDSIESYGLLACTSRLLKLYSQLIEKFEQRHKQDLTSWEIFQGRLEAEWGLLAEKASAIAAAVGETDADLNPFDDATRTEKKSHSPTQESPC